MSAPPVFPRFYPVLPDLDFVERLAPLGIRVVQLRLKKAGDAEIEQQISGALAVCARHNVQLIVNDYWQQAINLGADYVHLGQEDLSKADIGAIKAAGLKLGISTHDRAELATALAAGPDYVALGPVYETLLKKMKWRPQGLQRLRTWRKLVPPQIPLVAIGGITTERAPNVLAAGASSVAVVTDVVTAPCPEARVKDWVQLSG